MSDDRYRDYAQKEIERAQAMTPEEIAAKQAEVEQKFSKKFLRVMRKLGAGFARHILTAYFCLIDEETPLNTKAALVFALLYFISPFDFIPDILPFLGFSDDVSVLAIALHVIGQDIKDKHKEQADEKLKEWGLVDE